MSIRPSSTRRAMPRVALAVRRASRSSCRSVRDAGGGPRARAGARPRSRGRRSARRARPGARGRRRATSSTTAWTSSPAGAPASTRAATPSTGRELASAPDLRTVTSASVPRATSTSRYPTPPAGDEHGTREHGQDVAAVRSRSGRAPRAPGDGLRQHLDRVRVEPYGDRAEQLLARRVDQVDPRDRHGAPRLALAPVGTAGQPARRRPTPTAPRGAARSATAPRRARPRSPSRRR